MPTFLLQSSVEVYSSKIENLKCPSCNCKLSVIGSVKIEYGKYKETLMQCQGCKTHYKASQVMWGLRPHIGS